MAEMKYWVVVGISGVTYGGKTTLTKLLHEKFVNSVVFSQDDYFFPGNDSRHTVIPELNHVNWEIMSSLDMKKMRSDVSSALSRNHSDGTPRVMILEGFLVLNDSYFAKICDLKFFFTLTRDQCWERRSVGTLQHVYPDPPGYFDQFVWLEYEKHKDEACKINSDLVCIDGARNVSITFNEVVEKISLVLNKYS